MASLSPLSRVGSGKAKTRSARGGPSSAWPGGARILVVDDEPINVARLCQLLEADGYAGVKPFGDPRALLAEAAREEPDLVVLDLHMPWMDGFQLLAALRRVFPSGHFVPVLALTADSSPKIRERALSAGAHDFLTKPFDLTEVRVRTRNLLATRGLHRQLLAQNALLEDQVRERTHDPQASRVETAASPRPRRRGP